VVLEAGCDLQLLLLAGENGFLAFFKLIVSRKLLLGPKNHLMALL
jgi:hypothetical protein